MYEAKDFSHLLGMSGFSDELLNNHFTLYNGYVANTNKVLEGLEKLTPGTPEHSELRRRFGWEFAGMRLHELYFGNLKKEEGEMDETTEVYKKIVASFGSKEAAKESFMSIASTRGIGWVVAYYDKVSDKIFHVWVEDHNTNHLPGAVPLVVMDMWEHAFLTDYGLKKPDYVSAFLKHIDWAEVERRFLEA